ncbi:GNAT family N-acetyltransferase [Halorientalis brevis]|uniref:GNAT family N-acetyltransferase n=1 Tax=Halorientalis brevis TaxID=1126241 RepID=A0ABD6CFI6_9EURY|nr:GNAT family N-acetyltransferase [Halorientalis brevis]
MEIREATAADAGDVRRIVRRSLTESYGDIIDEETRDAAVDGWYGDDAVESLCHDLDVLLLVAEVEDDLAGFAQSELVDHRTTVGEIQWLHVDPAYRGQGVAERLFEETVSELSDEGAEHHEGLVLASHDAGNAFYTERGFELVDTRSVEIAGETYTENVYSDIEPAENVVQPETTADGKTLYVDYSERARGSKGPFYAAYTSRDCESRYGWFCANCASFDTAMDPMGRIVCNECDNQRKATRWDAAHI